MFEFMGNTVAFVTALLDSVPIPNTSDPLRLAVGLEAEGNSTITPWLSVVNDATGFCTCCARASGVRWRGIEGMIEEVKSAPAVTTTAGASQEKR